LEHVQVYSGHGGLAFTYDPWLKEGALDLVYALSRRYWGIDVEDLNDTLPLMKNAIKGVNWITVIGSSFLRAPKIQAALSALITGLNVTVDECRHGDVIVAGRQPALGDQHRPDLSLEPYYAVASALAPLFLEVHPDFPSERFVTNGNTVGWIRRFIDPNGWR
jgi:hypothetical protein